MNSVYNILMSSVKYIFKYLLKKLEKYKADRRQTLALAHLEEMEKLEEKLGKTTEMLK